MKYMENLARIETEYKPIHAVGFIGVFGFENPWTDSTLADATLAAAAVNWHMAPSNSKPVIVSTASRIDKVTSEELNEERASNKRYSDYVRSKLEEFGVDLDYIVTHDGVYETRVEFLSLLDRWRNLSSVPLAEELINNGLDDKNISISKLRKLSINPEGKFTLICPHNKSKVIELMERQKLIHKNKKGRLKGNERVLPSEGQIEIVSPWDVIANIDRSKYPDINNLIELIEKTKKSERQKLIYSILGFLPDNWVSEIAHYLRRKIPIVESSRRKVRGKK